MKVSNVNARADKTGKHNDRNFDLSRSGHIDAERSEQNVYWTYNGDYSQTFAKVELDFYNDHFKDHVEKQNERYRSRRQSSRVKSMEKYRTSLQSRPEDKILQIGNMEDHPDPEVLWECALEYQKRFNELYGSNCVIVDMALHLDEATPHVHVRRVWLGHDDAGDMCVGQERALEELGILPPDTMAPISRNNNAKITFTDDDNELFRGIVRDRGIEIEEPSSKKKEHLSSLEYKKKMVEEDTRELTIRNDELKKENDEIIDKAEKAEETIQDACDMMEELMRNPYFNGEYDEKLKKIHQLELMQQYEQLAAIYYAEILPEIQGVKDSDLASLGRKYNNARSFIKENGLDEEYKEYLNDKKKHREHKAR